MRMTRNHELEGVTAGLCQDGLGEGAQRKSGRHETCLEECAHPGNHHNRNAGVFPARGEVIIENIFGLPGLGRLIVTATRIETTR